MRRTKIVCTIGPASSSPEALDRLVAAGMDVARLNFSHGTHAEHAEVIRAIREGEAQLGPARSRSCRTSRAPRCASAPSWAAQATLTTGEPFS